MIVSSADVPSGQAPIFIVETMRGYNAYFVNWIREKTVLILQILQQKNHIGLAMQSKMQYSEQIIPMIQQ
jgi:hypothetical protein